MASVLRIVEFPPPRKHFGASFDVVNHIIWWGAALILFMGPVLFKLYTSYYIEPFVTVYAA